MFFRGEVNHPRVGPVGSSNGSGARARAEAPLLAGGAGAGRQLQRVLRAAQ